MAFVVVEREHPIAIARINRPEVRNALNVQVMDELVAALEELDAEEMVRAIVLTGDEKAFSAGADITGFVEATPITMLHQDLTARWERIRRWRSDSPSRPSIWPRTARSTPASNSSARPFICCSRPRTRTKGRGRSSRSARPTSRGGDHRDVPARRGGDDHAVSPGCPERA